LRVNSENRPDMAKILEHAYFKDSEPLETVKESREVKEVKEPIDKLKENKSFKYIKDVREEVPVKELKNIKLDNP
jgi:SH3-like domain-containing protein